MTESLGRRAAWYICLAGLLPLLGCDGGGATGPKGMASLGGSVSYDGKPVESGFISFLAEDGDGPTFGAPVNGGQYKVSGVWVGKKKVQIISGSPKTQATTTAPAPKSEQRLVNIPPSAVGNNQVLEIKPGSQTLDFKLEKPKL